MPGTGFNSLNTSESCVQNPNKETYKDYLDKVSYGFLKIISYGRKWNKN